MGSVSGLRTLSALAGIAVALLSASPSETSESAVVPSVETPAASLRAVEGYGKLPLYFIKDQGRLDPRVAYYIEGRDKSIYFTPERVAYAPTSVEVVGR